ncbi:MAG: hypothetical protein OIF38_15770, partial [Cellvibrionaceae bacterium]|nr:hypothetical protein [Cellvibrionaceae bacterium]
MLISKFSLKSGALAVAIASGLLLSACGEEPKTAEAPTEQAPAALEQAQPVAEQAMAKASEAAVALQQGTGSASSALSAQIAAVKAISAQVEGFALQGNIYAGGVPSKEQMQ